jgi:hypothetical protein
MVNSPTTGIFSLMRVHLRSKIMKRSWHRFWMSRYSLSNELFLSFVGGNQAHRRGNK